MVDPNISEQEKRCVRILAEWFNEGCHHIDNPQKKFADYELQLEKQEYETMMRMMEQYGAIENPTHVFGTMYMMFAISPRAVAIVRELDSNEKKAKEPGDLVEQIKEKAYAHPVLAWIIIIFFAVASIVTVLNQAAQLLERLGLIPGSTK